MVDGEDLDRFAQIGIVADFQQSADAIDTGYHEYLSEFVGNQAFDLIPGSELLDAGATASLSSDWDASPLLPLGTIQRALTRDTKAVPDQQTATAMSNIEAADALGHGDVTGSITVVHRPRLRKMTTPHLIRPV